MDALSVLVLGVALWFNFITIYYKLKNGNILNGIFDGIMLIGIMWLTAGSIAGLSIGTIASALFSVYLFFDPIESEILISKGDKIIDIVLYSLPFSWSKKMKKKRKKKLKKKSKIDKTEYVKMKARPTF